MTDCPCCSGKVFSECCESIIKEELAPTALSLMRSRFTAYQKGDAQYLYNTSHPKIKHQFNAKDIEEWCKENIWTSLEIVSQEHGGRNDSRGIVEFKAYYKDKNNVEELHHEKSIFVKENGKWLYTEGVINPPRVNIMQKVSRNDPCPCGSGKKQKKCCGKVNK